MGYLQKENNNVIESYNMFSRYRWQTYILAEAATAVMGPGMAAAVMATPTATVRVIPAPGATPGPPRKGLGTPAAPHITGIGAAGPGMRAGIGGPGATKIGACMGAPRASAAGIGGGGGGWGDRGM